MNLALFDFDGTITSQDTFTAFMNFAIDPWRLAVGKVLLAPLVLGYKAGVVSPSNTRRMVVWAGLRGIPESQAQQAGVAFAQNVLPSLVRLQALERIRWHQARGDKVVVVSASLNVYLVEWCRQLELDLLCSELEVKAGYLTGRYRLPDCCGAEKSRRVMAQYDLATYRLVYAYGDTPEDLDMLSLADVPVYQWNQIQARTLVQDLTKRSNRRVLLRSPRG